MTRRLATTAALVLALAPLAGQAQQSIANDWQMTAAERAYFGEAIGACWTVTPATRVVTVRVRFEMTENGEVIDNYVELLETRGGDSVSQSAAYESVRRAILRCEGRGYDLPVEKYEIWREVVMSFNGRNGTMAE